MKPKGSTMEQIQMQYDIIFGQSYIMVPICWTEIKPVKVLGQIQTLKKTNQKFIRTKNK